MTGYFETGDRVTLDVNRNGFYDEHGLHAGGEWIVKTGTVETANEHKMFVKFDDGDVQSTANVRGRKTGFPGRKAQPMR